MSGYHPFLDQHLGPLNLPPSSVCPSVINRGFLLEAAWIPGHCDFKPNEDADRLAKAAARRENTVIYPCERTELKNKIKEMAFDNWQQRVNSVMVNETVLGAIVNKWIVPRIKNVHWLWQLASGHNKLNKFTSHLNSSASPLCECLQVEDAHHFIYSCERYSRLRFDLLNKVNFICEAGANTLHAIPWMTLLGQDSTLSMKKNTEIMKAVIEFVCKTRRFPTRQEGQ